MVDEAADHKVDCFMILCAVLYCFMILQYVKYDIIVSNSCYIIFSVHAPVVVVCAGVSGVGQSISSL